MEGKDAKFFSRGKIADLKKELHEADVKDKKYAKRKVVLKKIIANITMGNDMSPLFRDMVACMSIQVLEIKKMVYLYLVSYGRGKPDEIQYAIVNFLTDCNDRNPLIRALAIRTMAYIPVPSVTMALIDPLRHCLRDGDPYVRKTAAICVAKLYVYDPKLVDKEGFITMLRDLLADPNPTVVANAVASLMEISERSDDISLKLNINVANKLIAALGECSEWGQIYILDSLLSFVPQLSLDAEGICERILPRLQHANSAVVLTTIKILIYMMNYINDEEVNERFCKKMGAPLVTLLATGPEIQYVTLRNILLIIQRRPSVLKNDVKVFFCKYNDPIYVKLAKLEIMYRLSREDNYRAVLTELHEYASEVDVDFVRKAVRTIGRLAVKITAAANACMNVLVGLLESKISYVTQEVVVVIKDILRRYPSQYESVIAVLCQNMDDLTESEAKAAIIWIIGQYADRIDNSVELMEDLSFSFLDDPAEVQLAFLTAVVKLFLRKPETAKDLVSKTLKVATEEVDNPDLRDRGFMYWRLLSTNAGAAKDIVLAEKPTISTEADRMDRGALDQLLLYTGTLGSIYHKAPETFIRYTKPKWMADSPALNNTSRQALIAVMDDSLPAPLPEGSIPPPPPPRQLSPGPQPNATLSTREAQEIRSPIDELGGRQDDEEAREEEEAEAEAEAEDAEAEDAREALSSKRYGDADAGADPYANLGDAFA
ncbi:hypothetical protein FRB94_004550 [Tulasnella sp. JGI-2019a]|nr:hypothetical protein FRB93_000971 [Tulasnella sp. JGI-2019a]KAG9001730.1 hypothetical protein FRB94_004550 [Tulasnella sp. JGI-2019a]